MQGKEKCKALKEIRKQIAENNDIKYVVDECEHKGDCKGTCPKCEAEVRYLEKELEKKRLLGQKVAIAGVSLGVAATFSACTTSIGDILPFGNTSVYEEDLGGATEIDPDEELLGEPIEIIPEDEIQDDESDITSDDELSDEEKDSDDESSDEDKDSDENSSDEDKESDDEDSNEDSDNENSNSENK